MPIAYYTRKTNRHKWILQFHSLTQSHFNVMSKWMAVNYPSFQHGVIEVNNIQESPDKLPANYSLKGVRK